MNLSWKNLKGWSPVSVNCGIKKSSKVAWHSNATTKQNALTVRLVPQYHTKCAVASSD